MFSDEKKMNVYKLIILSLVFRNMQCESINGSHNNDNVMTTTEILTSAGNAAVNITKRLMETAVAESTSVTVTKTITKTTGTLQTEMEAADENTKQTAIIGTELSTGKQKIRTHSDSDDMISGSTFIGKMTTKSTNDTFYTSFTTMNANIQTTIKIYTFLNPDLPVKENYIKTDKTVLRYLAEFDNTYQRNVIETQLTKCPYVSLCGFSLNFITNKHSCCEECCCNSSCMTRRTCCPNTLNHSFSEFHNAEHNRSSNTSNRITINHTTWFPQCISKHLSVRPHYEQTGFYATAGCPDNINSELRVNCTRPYSEETEFKAFLPVYSNTTLDIFRNKYCALCNGINDIDIVFLQPHFACLRGVAAMHGVASEKDITKLVFAREECDITFVSLDTRIHFDYCKYSISLCNVTGLWETYEPETEHACLVYRSLFHHEQYVFQNVFCALCNGMIPHNVTCERFDRVESVRFSFSGLIKLDHKQDFDATKIVGDDLTECSQTQVFDSIMAECKDMYCSPMRMLKGGSCVNIYESFFANIGYVFYVRLLPFSEVLLINMFETIEFNLLRYLSNLFRNLPSQLSICDFVLTYTAVEKYEHGNTGRLQNSALAYADARISLDKHDTQKPWIITEEILNIHGTVLTLVDRFNVSVSFLVLVMDSDDNVFNIMDALVESIWYSLISAVNATEQVSILSEHSLPSVTGLAIISSTASLKKRPICMVEKDIYVLSFSSCPKVNMSRYNYLWTEKIDGITVGGIDIKSYQYYHTGKDHIMLCVDLFKKILASLRPDRKYSVETIVSVVSSVLSIVALFVTIIVYCILPELRKTLPGKNSLSLVISLFMAQIMLLVGSLNPFQQYSVECKVVGLIIHFSWLCSIFWMNVCTYHVFRSLSTTKLVSHDRGWNKFVFYITYVLTMAIVFVASNVIISTSVSGQFGYGGKFCYITSQKRILYTFVLPALLVISTNISLFLFVVIRIKRSSNIQRNVQNKRNELLIFAKLSTITGITWVFGFLYTWTEILIFSFIFIILNASQGIFIMFAYVVNRRVLTLCKNLTKL